MDNPTIVDLRAQADEIHRRREKCEKTGRPFARIVFLRVEEAYLLDRIAQFQATTKA